MKGRERKELGSQFEARHISSSCNRYRRGWHLAFSLRGAQRLLPACYEWVLYIHEVLVTGK